MQAIPGLAAARANSPFTNVRTEGASAPIDGEVSEPKLRALLKLAETHLISTPSFRHTARIGEADVELVTNVPHLLKWWRANWFAGQHRAKPDGRICAVMGVEKREPGVLYSPEALEAAAFNSDFYGHLHALGHDMAVRTVGDGGGMVLAGSALELPNRGVILLAGRSRELLLESALALNQDERINLIALSRVSVLPDKNAPVVRCLEDAFYLPGTLVRSVPNLALHVDQADGENVLTRLDECTNLACLSEVVSGDFRCVFHAGYRGCVWSDPHCGLLISPGWLNRSYERSREARLMGIAVLCPGQEQPDQEPEEQLPADVEMVPAKIAWSALTEAGRPAGKSAQKLDWLAPDPRLGEAEVKAFVDSVAESVKVVAVRHVSRQHLPSPDDFLRPFLASGAD